MPGVRHLGMLRFIPELSTAQLVQIRAGLESMDTRIPGIETLVVTLDDNLRPDNHDLLIEIEFLDEPSFHAFREHPVHRRVVDELIEPVIEGRAFVSLRRQGGSG